MKKISVFLFVSMLGTLSFARDMTVQSSSWKEGEVITDNFVFNGFGCSGQNLSPQISWKDLPKNTKSVAVTIYDPDAPTGSGWWHWIVYNIPAKKKSLPEGEGKPGRSTLTNGIAQNTTDFGNAGYGGPCPPPGDKPHHYIVTVHALDIDKLELPPNATGAMAGFYINQHTISKASLTSLYSRK